MTRTAAIAGLGLLGVGAWLAMRSTAGRTTGTASRDLILSRFSSAGLPGNLGIASAVNSYAESAWDSSAVSGYSGEDSVGLFQLNSRGLGAGIALPRMPDGSVNPADPRLDPTVNTDVVIAECRKYAALLMPSSSVHALTDLFVRYVERPADPNGESARRQALISTLFPGVV